MVTLVKGKDTNKTNLGKCWLSEIQKENYHLVNIIIGGRIKSIVMTKVMSQKSDAPVIQSITLFANLTKGLIHKTSTKIIVILVINV